MKTAEQAIQATWNADRGLFISIGSATNTSTKKMRAEIIADRIRARTEEVGAFIIIASLVGADLYSNKLIHALDNMPVPPTWHTIVSDRVASR